MNLGITGKDIIWAIPEKGKKQKKEKYWFDNRLYKNYLLYVKAEILNPLSVVFRRSKSDIRWKMKCYMIRSFTLIVGFVLYFVRKYTHIINHSCFNNSNIII